MEINLPDTAIDQRLLPSANAEEEGKLLYAKTAKRLTSPLTESLVNEFLLALLKFDNTILDRVLDQDPMDFDGALLANAVCSVNSLHLNERVPERIKNNDSRSSNKIESRVPSLQGNQHDFGVAIISEPIDGIIPSLSIHTTVVTFAHPALLVDGDLEEIQKGNELTEDNGLLILILKPLQQFDALIDLSGRLPMLAEVLHVATSSIGIL